MNQFICGKNAEVTLIEANVKMLQISFYNWRENWTAPSIFGSGCVGKAAAVWEKN